MRPIADPIDPVEAATLGVRAAPPGRRAAAFSVDAAIWLLLSAPTIIGAVAIAAEAGDGAGLAAIRLESLVLPVVLIAVGSLLTAVLGLVQLILHGRRGITIGKSALGLRSLARDTLRPLGFWRVTGRALILQLAATALPIIGPGILFASSLRDPAGAGRSWLDRPVGAWVIDRRAGLDPLDAAAVRRARREAAGPIDPGAQRHPSLATDPWAASTSFVPVGRSSAGVVSAVASAEAGEWVPPVVGPIVPAATPAAKATAAPAAAAGPDAPAAPAPAAAPVVVLDDGSSIEVSGTLLLGRHPVPSDEGAEVRLIALTDPSFELSKTHAAIGRDPDGRVWVADLGSVNGTLVRTRSGASERLAPHDRRTLADREEVAIGGRRLEIRFATPEESP